MKKILTLVFILSTALIISGCSLTSGGKQTSDGGIFKSSDFAENWEQKILISQNGEDLNTIGNVSTNFMVFDSKEEQTIYLVSQGAGIYKTTDRGEKWQPTSLSRGTYKSLSVDSLNNQVLYVTEGSKIMKTVDGMKSWHDIYIEKRPKQKLVSIIVNPFQSNIVYAATTSSLIKSFDYGNSWKLLDWQAPVISKLYLSNKNNNTLYALTNNGIYKSTNGAVEWFDVSDELREIKGALSILWLDFDQYTENIFIGTSAGIYKSLDGGASWQEIPTLFDFKKIPIKSVIANPSNLKEILFSVDNIIYKTDDAGLTWTTLKSVPTSRGISYMIPDPNETDVVYLGTSLPAKK